MTYHSDPNHVAFIFEGITTESSTPVFDDPSTFTLTRLNGFFTSEKTSIVSDGLSTVKPEISFGEGKSAIGEWLGVFSDNRNRYLISADPFGYQPVYYRFLPIAQTLLIGTSPQALANAARKSGEANAPDWSQLLGALGTTHAWSITMQSNQSFEANTKVLLPGQHIQVKDASWHVSSSAFFTPEDDYDALLDKGIARAIHQIRAASTLNVDQKQINLSGGKDSRMVLALLEASGVIDEFSVTTMNPKTWIPVSSRPALFQDLYVSNHLRTLYKLDWTKPFRQEYVPLSFEASLNEWQNYRQHRNFKFRASNHMYVQDGINIELRGAAGETFRGFKAVAGLMAKNSFQNSRKTLDRDIELLTEHLYGDGVLSDGQRNAVFENIRSLFSELGAETIQEGLHRRYTVFRNGSHFGHGRHSMSHGQIPILPLSQPEFVQASQLLSPGQRDAGQVAFDIIERVNPTLNEITFDGGFWTESLLSQKRRADVASIETESPFLERFFALDEAAIETRLASKRNNMQHKGNPRAFDARFETINRIKQTLHELHELSRSTASEALNLKGFQRELLQGLESKKLPPAVVLAKLDSMKRAVSGGPDTTTIVVRSANPAASFFLGRSSENARCLPEIYSHPNFQLPLKLKPGSVEANIRQYGSISQPMEFSFSLFTDGKRTSRIGYSASQTATFDRPQNGKSRIQAFARYTSSPDIIFKFYSRYF